MLEEIVQQVQTLDVAKRLDNRSATALATIGDLEIPQETQRTKN